MELTQNLLKNFRLAKNFGQNSDVVNSIDYHSNGESLITGSDDDSIIIYDCAAEGKPKRTLYSKKYGVANIKYTHSGTTVVYSSRKVNNDIRYQSLHDNKYIRYYSGHKDMVTSLTMSPTEDHFLSASIDQTVRLWDLRTPNCQGHMQMMGRPVISFDPEGLIFAVGINSEIIKLYDLKSFDKGPFSTFKLAKQPGVEWRDLKFSGDGKMILISTNTDAIQMIDAFNGMPIMSFFGRQNTKNIDIEASFTPDGKFVISGSEDGKVLAWDATTGDLVNEWEGTHVGPVTCCRFNPKYMMFTSCCKQVKFWLPTTDM